MTISGPETAAHPVRAGIPSAGKPARANSWTIARLRPRGGPRRPEPASCRCRPAVGPAWHSFRCTLSGSGVAWPNCGAGRVARRQCPDHRRAAPSCSGAGLASCPPVRPNPTACVASGVIGAGSASGFSLPLRLHTASPSDPATPDQGVAMRRADRLCPRRTFAPEAGCMASRRRGCEVVRLASHCAGRRPGAANTIST